MFTRPCHGADNILDKEFNIRIHTIFWIRLWVVDVSIEEICTNIFNDDHPKIVTLVFGSCSTPPLDHSLLLTGVKLYFKTHMKWYKCMIVWILCYFIRCFWRPSILGMVYLSAYNTLLEGVIISLIKMYGLLENTRQLYSIVVFGVIYLIIGRI